MRFIAILLFLGAAACTGKPQDGNLIGEIQDNVRANENELEIDTILLSEDSYIVRRTPDVFEGIRGVSVTHYTNGSADHTQWLVSDSREWIIPFGYEQNKRIYNVDSVADIIKKSLDLAHGTARQLSPGIYVWSDTVYMSIDSNSLTIDRGAPESYWPTLRVASESRLFKVSPSGQMPNRELNDSTLFGGRWLKSFSSLDTNWNLPGKGHLIVDSTSQVIAYKWSMNPTLNNLYLASTISEMVLSQLGPPDFEHAGTTRVWNIGKFVVIEYVSLNMNQPKYWIVKTTKEYYEG